MSSGPAPTGHNDDLRDRLERRLHTCTEVCPDGVPPDLCEFALDSHYAIDVLLPTILAYADQRADQALETAAADLCREHLPDPNCAANGWLNFAARIVREHKTVAS